ncbi:hypothetical protein [Streptomyces sp. 6N223]|uniref:hypothetical protein n=1 Tax=Streptomyces sp. 6N223 TaxID=3457412 RepID=UPI003FD5A337
MRDLLAAAAAEPRDRAAYLTLIGQDAQRQALAPDGSLLALAYRAAPAHPPQPRRGAGRPRDPQDVTLAPVERADLPPYRRVHREAALPNFAGTPYLPRRHDPFEGRCSSSRTTPDARPADGVTSLSCDNPEAPPVRFQLLNGVDHSAAVDVRYRPVVAE